MKKSIVLWLMCIFICPLYAYTQTSKGKPKVDQSDNETDKVHKDKHVLDPDTLRFAYHAQKTGIPLDTNSNLELYYKIYEWLGTPYRFGGSTRKGIDCSGFTSVICKGVYKREIPRDSRSIFKVVDVIPRDEMKEGDLVFFRISRGQISHVGVYLGENKFVHASTQRGVIISDLREGYYKRYFYKAGRLKDLSATLEGVMD